MNEILRNIKKEVAKDLKQGKYKNTYLIYNRRSTDEPDSQKNSIKYQRSENQKHAQSKQLNIAEITIPSLCTKGIISEKHSGFKEDDFISFTEDGRVQYKIERPKFQILLNFLNQGYFKGVICLCWDRISRNKADNTIIEKLMRRGIDFRFAFASYDNTSAGALHMDIDGMVAQHHSRVTSEKVRLALRSAKDRGLVTHRAPIGYLNTGSMEQKPLDPKRAPIIRELFELYATGDWSLSDLARHAKKLGLTSVPMRKKRTKAEILADEDDEVDTRPLISKPLSENRIQELLRKPFYLGKIKNSKGQLIQSISHEPLIDQETFDMVQRNLTQKNISIHYTKKIEYSFRGLLRCGECGRVYTPYKKKGHQYFYCRCVKECSNANKNIKLDTLNLNIRNALSEISFTQKATDYIEALVQPELKRQEENREKEKMKRKRHKAHLLEKLTYLKENKLDLLQAQTYTPHEFSAAIDALENEIADLEQGNSNLTEAATTINQVLKISELLKDVEKLFPYAKMHEKELISRKLFSELQIDENTLIYKVKNGLECVMSKSVLSCAPKRWISELLEKKDDIKTSLNELESLSEYLQKNANRLDK